MRRLNGFNPRPRIRSRAAKSLGGAIGLCAFQSTPANQIAGGQGFSCNSSASALFQSTPANQIAGGIVIGNWRCEAWCFNPRPRIRSRAARSTAALPWTGSEFQSTPANQIAGGVRASDQRLSTCGFNPRPRIRSRAAQSLGRGFGNGEVSIHARESDRGRRHHSNLQSPKDFCSDLRERLSFDESGTTEPLDLAK